MGPPVIWDPPYSHINSDMGPGEVHASSALGPPSDMDPSTLNLGREYATTFSSWLDVYCIPSWVV